MAPTLAALIAAFALGANLLGAGVLLLFNPRSRAVRWYVLFQLAVSAWLLVQGGIMMSDGWARWGPLHAAVVHLLPGAFLAFALVNTLDWPLRRLAGVLALALLFLPASLAASVRGSEHMLAGAAVWLWQAGAWGSGSALVWWSRRKLMPSGRMRPRTNTTLLLLSGIPVAVVVGFLLDGDFFFLYVMPLVTVGVQLLGFYGVARLRFYDIEVRAARSGELAAHAAEQERLAVLGEIAASLAHEIRNPLTGVRSLAQRLAEEAIDEERRRRYATVILEETGRVERIVSNLLGLAKRTTIQPQADAATPLAPLFEDLSLLLDAHTRKAGVLLAVEGAHLVAPAPRETLAQALLNLLLNAVAHSPRGGRVELLAREGERGVELLVRDAGPGVPAAVRDQIFEPFHTGSDGTGLGLAVVRRLARELGWELAVGDVPGGGAEFRIVLPRVGRSEAARVPVAAGPTAGI
jgi:signal transduction histidine kinase